MPWTWLSFISLIASRPGFSLTANNCFQLTVLSMLFQWFPDEKGVASCFSFTLLLWSFFFFFFPFFFVKKKSRTGSQHCYWFDCDTMSDRSIYLFFSLLLIMIISFASDWMRSWDVWVFFPFFSFLFNVSFYRLLPWMNDLSIRLEIKFASRLH